MPAERPHPAMPSDGHPRDATEAWVWAGAHREESRVEDPCPELLVSGEKLPLGDVAWAHAESGGQTPGKDDPVTWVQ